MRPSPGVALRPVRSARTLATGVPRPAASESVWPAPLVRTGSSCQIESIMIVNGSPSGSVTPLMVMLTNLWFGGHSTCDAVANSHTGLWLVRADQVKLVCVGTPNESVTVTLMVATEPSCCGVGAAVKMRDAGFAGASGGTNVIHP